MRPRGEDRKSSPPLWNDPIYTVHSTGSTELKQLKHAEFNREIEKRRFRMRPQALKPQLHRRLRAKKCVSSEVCTWFGEAANDDVNEDVYSKVSTGHHWSRVSANWCGIRKAAQIYRRKANALVMSWHLRALAWWSWLSWPLNWRKLLVLKLEDDPKRESVLIAASITEWVIRYYHEGRRCISSDKSYSKIIRRFYWPDVKKDVRLYIAACSSCERFLRRGRAPLAGLRPMET